MRFILCVSIAIDGTKLPFFVILKGKPIGNIEKQISGILRAGMLGCRQSKAWCDECVKLQCYDSVWKPYRAVYDGESGLLLDDYKVHTMESLMERMSNDNTRRFLIPGNCTSVLQPSEVDANKPLKERLKEAVSDWRSERCGFLPPGSRLLSPKRSEVLSMLQEIWGRFEMEIVRNAFIGSGYVFHDNVNYSMDTESESDIE